jgi:hypothetical protein
MAFVAKSQDKPQNERGQLNWELFKMERGEITQLTRLYSQISYAHISNDGSIIAFGSDPARARKLDLFVFDMKTKEIKPTGLLERIQNNPDFTLQ